MEPVAALSFAASVLQIVHFASSLISTSQRIYEAGVEAGVVEAEFVVKDFMQLGGTIQSWARPDPSAQTPLTKDNQRLETLALECEKVARELLKLLEPLSPLRVEENHVSILDNVVPAAQAGHFLDSVILAVKTVWNKKKIDEAKHRLGELRQELQFRILVTSTDDRIKKLDRKERGVVRSVINDNRNLAASLAAQNFELARQQQTSEAKAMTRHEQLVNLIHNVGFANVSFDYINIVNATTARIKSDLNFLMRNDRFDDIATAHQRTFEWALQTSHDEQVSWSNLLDWLRTGSGIYWISGKAGSGKSTLMKFLHRHWRLMDALRSWAGDCQLIVLRFYFWNSGTNLQKSQEGLFRSLLYQVLDQAPTLGPSLFPDRYDQTGEDGPPISPTFFLGSKETSNRWADFPTFHELKRAFRNLTTQFDGSHKIVMLVDGLDEFDAPRMSMTELAEIFTAASQLHVKTLVSSRPLPAFEASFASLPKLRLHQLTHGDITAFVHDKLGAHPRVQDLSLEDPEGTQALISMIVDSASGVFLWVSLVVQSLIEGLQNFDTLGDLNRRLQELPRDLEDFFRHMLRQIPPGYKAQSSRFFQLLRSNNENPEASSAQYSPAPLTAVGLYYAEHATNVILNANIAPMPETEVQVKEKKVDGRLRSRCAGLLELKARKKHASFDAGYEVVYLHRTVADFLMLPDVWSDITKHSPDYDTYTPLIQSLLMRLKRAKIEFPADLSESWRSINAIMHFAQLAERNLKTPHNLLNELDKTMHHHFDRLPEYRQYCEDWCDTRPGAKGRSEAWHDNLLSLAIQQDLTLYVRSTTKKLGSVSISKKGRPLLHYACLPDPKFNDQTEYSLDMILILLQAGAEPNQKFGGISPWQIILQTQIEDPLFWISVVQHMVNHGADAKVYVTQAMTHKSCLRVLKEKVEFIKSDESISAATKTRLRSEVSAVVKQLKHKGARDEEWKSIDGALVNIALTKRTDECGSPQADTRMGRTRKWLEKIF